MWHQFSSSSWSDDMDAQIFFLGDTVPRTQLLIVPVSRTRAGRVDSYAMFPQESEVLLPLCSRLRVLSCCRDLHGLTQIHLQGIEPTDPILLFSESFKIGGDGDSDDGWGVCVGVVVMVAMETMETLLFLFSRIWSQS